MAPGGSICRISRVSSHPPQDASQYASAASRSLRRVASFMGFGRSGITFPDTGRSFFTTFRTQGTRTLPNHSTPPRRAMIGGQHCGKIKSDGRVTISRKPRLRRGG